MTDYRYVIVGIGNLAWHLERMLIASGANPVMMNSGMNANSSPAASFESMDLHDSIVFLTVRDAFIGSMANHFRKAFLVHCSGGMPLDVLPKNRSAVLWPLQTFTKGVEMKYDHIPFIIESENPGLRDELVLRFSPVSDKVVAMNSEMRRKVHLAAVVAQNFSNRMIAEADMILCGTGYDYTLLLPLLSESLRKLEWVNPIDAQTGPAVRGDFEVLNSHLKMCDGDEGLKELYRLISERINPLFKHE